MSDSARCITGCGRPSQMPDSEYCKWCAAETNATAPAPPPAGAKFGGYDSIGRGKDCLPASAPTTDEQIWHDDWHDAHTGGRESDNNRDADWILAIGHALGTDSGHMIPIVPSVEEFRKLFAAVRAAAERDAARYREVRSNPEMLLHLRNADFDAAIDGRMVDKTAQMQDQSVDKINDLQGGLWVAHGEEYIAAAEREARMREALTEIEHYATERGLLWFSQAARRALAD